MSIFSTKLRELREEKNLSMAELGKIIGVSDASICKWENDVNEPKLSYIKRLAEFFDESTDSLMGLADDELKPRKPYSSPSTVIPSPAPELSADEWAIIECYRKFSPHFKDLAQTTMKTWASAYDGAPNAGSKSTNKRA